MSYKIEEKYLEQKSFAVETIRGKNCIKKIYKYTSYRP